MPVCKAVALISVIVHYNGPIICIVATYACVHFVGFIEVAEVAVEPSDMSVEVGNEVQLKCSASGYQGDMFMYQWKHNGSNINGATDKTLIISSVNYINSGMYKCTVTNHWDDMMNSKQIQLTVTGKLFESSYRKQGKIHWAKLLRFSWFSRVPRRFFSNFV